jgi:uncharacterized protein YbjT (DUF2867 family)
MKKILITGATGNIGFEVIRFLYKNGTTNKIVAGVRDIAKAKVMFKDFPQLELAEFNFEDRDLAEKALEDVNCVFLLRPPHLSNIEIFRPFVAKMKEKGISEVAFLSVQGAEKSKIIPHNKIEKLIRDFSLNYVFLRPGYFMQNLTTTLIEDLRTKNQIILPAGKAKFNWVDIENIAEVTSVILENFDLNKNQAIEITGSENENFETVSKLLSKSLDKKIEFVNVNPLRFYNIKKEQGMAKGMILVMIMLHFLPRFQKEPVISNNYEKLTGKKPTKIIEFITRERQKF